MKQKDLSYGNTFSVLLLFAVLAILLSLALFGLHKVGLVDLSFTSDGTAPDGDDGQEITALLNSIANREKNGETVFVMLDSSVIKDVLATGKAGNQYLHEYTITYGDSGSAAIHCSVVRKNSDFHLLEFVDSKIVREVKLIGGKAKVFDSRVGINASLDSVPEGYFEQTTGSISAIDIINFVINYHAGDPVTWKMGNVLNCTVETVREESVNMARITMEYDDHMDVYMLDIDRSALYSCETYVESILVSRMQTTKISYDIENTELGSVLDE